MPVIFTPENVLVEVPIPPVDSVVENRTLSIGTDVVLVRNTTDCVITLDDSFVSGSKVTIKRLTENAVGTVTIVPQVGSIDGIANFELSEINTYVTIIFDGVNWFVVSLGAT